MQNWAKFAGFGEFLVVALVGSLLWALNYPIQQAEWTCQTKPPIEQSTTVTVYKLVRCKPDKRSRQIRKSRGGDRP